MAAIITERFSKNNAENFITSFSTTNYYAFLGKTTPFIEINDGTGNTDISPPVPNDDVTSEYYHWDDMVAAKKINSTDVSHVIPRRNYTVGETYDMYEHDISSSNTTTSGATNLWNSTFYFMTSAYRVYKVLDNNGGTATSSSEPTNESTSAFQTTDGYTLKYLYTLTPNQTDKFLTNDFMPVSVDSTVSNAAVDGSVDVVRVTAGSGYTDETYYAAIKGDGSGGVVKIVVSGGEIQAFGSSGTTISNAGTGYTFGSVDLTDVYSDSGLSSSTSMGSGTNGLVDPIISPRGGHGNDAVSELGGHYVMMNAKFEQNEENDFTIENDFRRVGILSDPYSYGSTTNFIGSTARQTYAILFSTFSGTFEVDEKITQVSTGAQGKVVEWDSSNKILYYTQERFNDYGVDSSTGNLKRFSGNGDISGSIGPTPPTGQIDTSTGSVPNIPISFSGGYANPELQPDSGNIIYIENRKPISRASDQTEDIKIIVEF